MGRLLMDTANLSDHSKVGQPLYFQAEGLPQRYSRDCIYSSTKRDRPQVLLGYSRDGRSLPDGVGRYAPIYAYPVLLTKNVSLVG